jgi:pantoate--beta-alanine ligase
VIVTDSIEEIRAHVAAAKAAGRTLAFVPTMGFLHEGHLSLLDHARRAGEEVVMSVFVNPLQFGPEEDLDRYPRDLERDARLAEWHGTDAVFAPGARAMYPDGAPCVTVDPGPQAARLCGAYRPGHFAGVLTVVAKLFAIVEPDVAVFGAKDYQQAVLVRRMVRDLNMPVRIAIAPLVREPDGVALSSRNAYLGPDERRDAASLSRGLMAARAAFQDGERGPERLTAIVRAAVEAAPSMRLQYAELVGPDSLEPSERARAGDVLAAAAFAGETRLIDNVAL